MRTDVQTLDCADLNTSPMNQLPPNPIEADFLRELREIEAESMGWQALEPGVYLHAGDPQAEDSVEADVVEGAGPNAIRQISGGRIICRRRRGHWK